MKNLELNQMEVLTGGCDEHQMIEAMFVGAAWGALFGSGPGAIIGAWGAAVNCLINN